MFTQLHQRGVRQPHGPSAGAAGMSGMPHIQNQYVELISVVMYIIFVVMYIKNVVMYITSKV